ncbi:MAG: asparagine--tRNA ligase [Candidatus Shikimatogenerans sp. AspAUS03]|uniref:Asparagine--tRNA ligase n=1 Tax=Candidatus Shikimatogenerans sp. AspAUS03 TaxID=3158563 RepID=A0AAU7QSC8_9FLAO
MDIKTLYLKKKIYINKYIQIIGWIKHFRNNKFLEINDGTYNKNIQILINFKYSKIFLSKLTIGSSLKVKGFVKLFKNNIEILSNYILIYHSNKIINVERSILQKKKHSLSIIRKQNFLRFQTNLFFNILLIKNFLLNKINNFLYKNNFIYIHTPIITNVNPENILKVFKIKNNFFKKNLYLTVSGQFENELSLNGLKKVYTFGPVFRAEKSSTKKHLAEFWMLEIEIAFSSFKKIILFIKKFINYLFKKVISSCRNELFIIDKFNKKKKNYSINNLLNLYNKYKIVSYVKIIKIINNKFKKNYYGKDLNIKMENYILNYYLNKILIIINYPKNIKPFYMKLNFNNKTVKSFDILFPKIGEIIGGSQREDNIYLLNKKIKDNKLTKNIKTIYSKIINYNNIPHSGFGLGFDRLIQFITNVNNIKDVVEYPIFYNN